MELTEFLRARLDEDEAAAYGLCGNGPLARWVIRDGDLFVGTEPLPDEPIVQTWDGRVARHIARHDPARVLREVEAKREILYLHKVSAVKAEQFKFDPYTGEPVAERYEVMCDTCGWAGEDPTSACMTLRALAAVWSDHPDYDPAWRA